MKRFIILFSVVCSVILGGCSAVAALTKDVSKSPQPTVVLEEKTPVMPIADIPAIRENLAIQHLQGCSPCLATDDLPFDYENAWKLLEEWSYLNVDLMVSSFEHIDMNTPLEIEDFTYYLLDPDYADGWKYYEEQAKEIFMDDYVNTIFTPTYTEKMKLFYEKDDQLYRQASDGVTIGNYKDSMQVWHKVGDVYYISVKTSSDETEGFRIFQVIFNPQYKYQFKIAAMIDFIMDFS
jgi:hypothetical protein